MIEFTYYDIKRVAEEIIDEKGFDFRYISPGNSEPKMHQNCYNWTEDENGNKVPSCIVGTILHRLGVPLESMEPNWGSPSILRDLAKHGVIPEVTDRRIQVFLNVAQATQDNGGTWYSAVKAAWVAVMNIAS